MGQVYKAFDPRLHRNVAIKVARERVGERFDREVRALAALNHPNICSVYDVGPDYLVMELVEGQTLRDCLSRALPQERARAIARQMLEALAAAHRAGVLHRDLKPENVMLRADGYVKVLDFGLARWLQATPQPPSEGTTLFATGPGRIAGTAAYMSPEQIEERSIDARSDLFAFGTVLYEMVAGRHPWRRSSVVDTLHAIVHDDPPPIFAPHPSADLDGVLQRLLRKNPSERYGSAEAVLEAIETSSTGYGSSHGARTGVPPVTSIAIPPFMVLGHVDDSKALSLGFADALITVLANLEDVVVSPTSAILKYSTGVEPAQVCRDLGVRQALQGTVQKLGDHWRVSIQLFDAATSRILISEKHDVRRPNVFDVQDEIGRLVVESLHSRFNSAPGRSRDRYSSDPEAYNAFMAGLRDSAADQLETLRIAAEHLARAVEHDPGFALAHATLSLVCMHIHFDLDPQRSWLRQAEDHCARALELDPELPEGHLARAWILWSPAKGFQHAQAIASLDRVLAARPNLERAHNRMASICLHIGRLREGRLAHERALRSNPRTRTGNLEYFHIYSGDFASAEEAAEAWFRERPGNLYAVMTRILPPLLRGDLDLAERRMATVPPEMSNDPTIVSLHGLLHARRGRADDALECARKSLESPVSFGHTHHVYYQVACIYAVLGDTDTALAWLERTADNGFPCWPFFLRDPNLENLREEPRFKRLIADLERTYTTLRIASYDQ